MPVPSTFTEHFDREIERKVGAALRLARSIQEDIGYVVLRLEREGATGGACAGTSFVALATELAADLATLRELTQLRKDQRAFDQAAVG